jgi:hypothetical protein
MKKPILIFVFSFAILFSNAQSSQVKEIDRLNPAGQALAPLRFLASDELMGRATTRPEVHIAARYIIEQFRSYGLKEVPGTENYVQGFKLKMITPVTSGTLTIGNKTYHIGVDLLQARGSGLELTAPIVFAGFGSAAELANLDVKGKIVLTNMGENDSTKVQGAGRFRDAKQKLLFEKGALALIERYGQSDADWEMPKHVLTSQRAQIPQDTLLPVFFVHDPSKELPAAVAASKTCTIQVSGSPGMEVKAENVMGWIEGTDPQLSKQFIVLSAHYDHIGIASEPKMIGGKLDSIYNGARDNAIGVTAVINAARYFSQHPAKRSILFIAFTGEEMGLLGSKYFAAHPTIALEKIVYNLNIDNGGVNDTSQVNLIGLGRTSADNDISKASAAYGLTLKGDPAPEMGLFDRSDNVSFAAKGVPAPSYGMGVKQLDENIMRYYHGLEDEVGNIDLNYVVKYMKSYILAASFIADNPAQPHWVAGDKYESAWKELYSK